MKHAETLMVLFIKNPLQFQCPTCKRVKQRIDAPVSDWKEEMKDDAKKRGWIK
jgi:hypothetical protein